jgi:hypothetical protein
LQVLNTYPEMITQFHLLTPLLIVGVIAALFVIGAIISNDGSIAILGILGCCGLFLLLIPIFSKRVPSGKMIMQVTFDDTIPISEFTKKYEIIGQDGLIYTIKEKHVG